MTLRVEDLKPGDVVRMEMTVRGIDKGWAMFQAEGDCDLCNEDLAAGNAELVVRPRPVRKGDEVLLHRGADPEPLAYLARSLSGRVYMTAKDGVPRSGVMGAVTHADGSPIDWEASE